MTLASSHARWQVLASWYHLLVHQAHWCWQSSWNSCLTWLIQIYQMNWSYDSWESTCCLCGRLELVMSSSYHNLPCSDHQYDCLQLLLSTCVDFMHDTPDHCGMIFQLLLQLLFLYAWTCSGLVSGTWYFRVKIAWFYEPSCSLGEDVSSS